MKGIVMSIEGSSCVVLLQDGTFCQMPNRNYKVGQRVSAASSSLRSAMRAAACLVLLLLTGVVATAMVKVPVSYVYLDVNPSVRLEINAMQKVISAVPLNGDAQTLLQEAPVLSGNVDACIEQFVELCRQQGYLTEENRDMEVNISTQTAALERKVMAAADALSGETCSVSVHRLSKKENKAAIKRNTSARRLRAVDYYSRCFGGTPEENFQKLKGVSTDEILESIRLHGYAGKKGAKGEERQR